VAPTCSPSRICARSISISPNLALFWRSRPAWWRWVWGVGEGGGEVEGEGEGEGEGADG
jgi:hypothetical protein